MHQNFGPEEPDEINPGDEFVGTLLPAGGVIGSWVLVAEVVTDDNVSLQVSTSRMTPPWSIMGMLIAAEGIVSESVEMTERDEE